MGNEIHQNLLVTGRFDSKEDQVLIYTALTVPQALQKAEADIRATDPDLDADWEVYITGIYTSDSPIIDHGYR